MADRYAKATEFVGMAPVDCEKNILVRGTENVFPILMEQRPSCPIQLRTETITRIVFGVRSNGPHDGAGRRARITAEHLSIARH